VFQTQNKNEGWFKIKDIIIVFLSSMLWFVMKFFLSWVFFIYVWACAYFLFPHCGLHSLIMLHNKWCSLHLIMWNKMIEKFNEPKKVGFSILLNVLLVYFLCDKNILLMCVLIIWLFFCFTLLLYNTKTYDINLPVFSQKCFKWYGYLSFNFFIKNLKTSNLLICQII
jgi:hypothetical protein